MVGRGTFGEKTDKTEEKKNTSLFQTPFYGGRFLSVLCFFYELLSDLAGTGRYPEG
jgi:hypothetical protein